MWSCKALVKCRKERKDYITYFPLSVPTQYPIAITIAICIRGFVIFNWSGIIVPRRTTFFTSNSTLVNYFSVIWFWNKWWKRLSRNGRWILSANNTKLHLSLSQKIFEWLLYRAAYFPAYTFPVDMLLLFCFVK